MKLLNKDFYNTTEMNSFLDNDNINYVKVETLTYVIEKTFPFPGAQNFRLNKTKIRLWYTENETTK
jgi:hypothetical protein